MTAFEERPHSPYYGSVDATPLYVVLLDEYERWTGDRALVRELEIEARAALNWIDEYADLQGTGYIWYRRRNEESGLENQCWKDSGTPSRSATARCGFPRATCELQGYVRREGARRAARARSGRRRARRQARARRGRPQAALQPRLLGRRRRVLRDRARPAGRRQVDALSSNNGHLLWSGIVDKSKAKAVARHLLGPRLFSGWGVRTLARARVATTRSGTTREPSGRSTTRSSPGDCGATASRRRRQRSPRASSMRRSSSTAGCRGVRRLSARADEVPGAVPDRVQPAGVVDWHAASAPANDARARAARRAPHRRSGSAERIGHLELLDIPAAGADRRVRSRSRRDRAEGARRADARRRRRPSPTRPAPSPARPARVASGCDRDRVRRRHRGR